MVSKGSVSLDVEADISKVAAQLKRDLDRIIKALNLEEVDIDADFTSAKASAKSAGKSIQRSLEDSIESAGTQATKTFAGIKAEAAALNPKIKVDIENRGGGGAALSGLAAGAVSGRGSSAGGKAAVTGADAISQAFTTLGSRALVIGSTVTPALIALGAAAIALASPLAIASVGLGATIPAAAGLAVGAVIPLVLAFNGLSDAFKNFDDPDKFAEAMKKLSPAAQEFVLSIKGVRNELVGLKLAAQEGFFGGLGPQVATLVKTLSPGLSAGIRDVADSFGGLTSRLISFLQSADGVKLVGGLFSTIGRIVDGLGAALAPFLVGISKLAVGALPAIESAFKVIGDGIAKFGTQLGQAAQDGSLNKLLGKTGEILKELFALGGSVFGLFRTLFAGGEDSGRGMIKTLTDVLDKVNTFLNTKEGQERLARGFKTIGTAMNVIVTVAAVVIKALSDVNNFLIETGGAIKNGVIAAFHGLVDAGKATWDALVTAFGAIKTAGKVTWDAIITAIKAVGDAAVWLYQNAIKPAWDGIVAAFMVVAGVVKMFWDAFKTAFDFVANIVRSFGNLIVFVFDHTVKPLFESAQALIAKLFDFWATTFSWVLENVLQPFWAGVKAVFDAIGAAAVWLYDHAIKPAWDAIVVAIQALGDAATWLYDHAIKPAFDGIAAAAGWIAGVFSSTFQRIMDKVGAVRDFFSTAFGAIKGFIVDAFQGALGLAKSSLNGLIKLLNSAVEGINDHVIDNLNRVPGVSFPHIPTIPMLAKGGNVNAGSPYLVGERGAEMFVPSEAGRIVPNNQMGGIGRWDSAPGQPVVVQLEWTGNDTVAGQVIAQLIGKHVRVRGGNVQDVLSGAR